MITKLADSLKKGIGLQPHQEAFLRKLRSTDALLAYHGLGSGKTLSSIASTMGRKTDVVVPASLRGNYKKEIDKFVEGGGSRNVISYEQAVKGGLQYTDSPDNALVIDEVQRIGNAGSKRSKLLREVASHYGKRVILSGTPAQNNPSELASVLHLLNPGSKTIPMNPSDFNRSFIEDKKVEPSLFQRLTGVKAGVEAKAKNLNKFRDAIKGKIHYYPTGVDGFPDRMDEMHQVAMSPEQLKIYKVVTDSANPVLTRKIRSGFPTNKQESSQLNAFMQAARQVSNSTLPYGGTEELSPKLRAVVDKVVANPKGRHVIYSNYIASGLEPVEKEFKNRGVQYNSFTGSMNDKEKAQSVLDFNSGNSNVLMLSSAGAEGIDLKGTRNIHILEPHWNKSKIDQVIGRGIRFGSHAHLPKKDRSVTVHKYQSVIPKTIMQKLLRRPADTSADTYLDDLAASKQDLLDQFLNVMKREGR